jgi:hypothetical protein
MYIFIPNVYRFFFKNGYPIFRVESCGITVDSVLSAFAVCTDLHYEKLFRLPMKLAHLVCTVFVAIA